MSHIESLLQHKVWRFWDQSLSGKSRSALESFAADDLLCHLVGQGLSPATVRTWVHDQTVVLGIQDHRLPFVEEAQDFLRTQGYIPIVRNSGGLAVVLDEGVLNISIVLSEQAQSVDISAGYDVMLTFIRLLFPEAEGKIEAYEIVGSYCPGSYDLSIDGKKFAGISQRRLRQGIAVQIYLCVEGSGSERAELIRQFYEIGVQGEETKFSYPVIKPEVMASLNELLNASLTVQDIVIRVQQVLQQLSTKIVSQSVTQDEMELYQFYMQRVVDRNKKMLTKE
ncbi:lipoate--protein ligase family protein [Psychrobacillus lasiicapitis]|uniref:Octanoyl-[GcvH]:protein N-octanoyltransferase n=1 Tax=Psychrobacillus lasiicapitis TaxID=1636719 RepID=A0A544TC93_9BACI|nr:lipoate--protein ligase family protein [Psychrobacillus lasiicapitis]TQR15016.1 lipoate--protein ligase family protein [Psychrobacillus lasiicapitis]GGA21785.1 octanoyl-[GcvH]:protein N-octanoyltransferase [Psychrobacillus lasiicapitis]